MHIPKIERLCPFLSTGNIRFGNYENFVTRYRLLRTRMKAIFPFKEDCSNAAAKNECISRSRQNNRSAVPRRFYSHAFINSFVMLRLPYSVAIGYAVLKSTIFPLPPKTFRSLTSSFFLGNISSRIESVINAAFSFPRNFDNASLANVPLPTSIHSPKMRFSTSAQREIPDSQIFLAVQD